MREKPGRVLKTKRRESVSELEKPWTSISRRPSVSRKRSTILGEIWYLPIVEHLGGVVSPQDRLLGGPLEDGVYLHPQILVLRLKVPLTNFVHEILSYFQATPSQLTAVAWRIVLSFEALCISFAPNSHRRENFCAIYSLRKTSQDSRFFIPRSSCGRLIVKLMNSDQRWCDTVIRLSGSWEVASSKSHGVVPTTWNRVPISQGSASVSEKVQERVRGLFHIDYDLRNWS